MCDKFKLDSNGTCQSCNVVAVAAENLQCFMCKTIYHCACPEMGEDDKVGTKSLPTTGLPPKGTLNSFETLV